MGRPREFDEKLVLDAAVQCFWAHGFEASSVRDLAGRTGLTGASLYNAFGDKRSLFRRALAHYVDQSFGDRVRRLEGNLPPRDAIAAFFEEIVEQSLGDPDHKGCLLVNSALEVAPHDAELGEAIGRVLAQIEAYFRRCVEAGQRDGTISTGRSAEDCARHLLCVLLGIRVLARARPERALLESISHTSLSLLDE